MARKLLVKKMSKKNYFFDILNNVRCILKQMTR